MTHTVDCPLCGFNDWAHSFAVDAGRVRRCRNCRLSRLIPAAGDRVDARPDNANVDQPLHALLSTVERICSAPSPLLAVVEHGHPLPDLARGRGWEVEVRSAAELESAALPAGRFRSVIVVSQLERAEDPIHALEVLRDAMTADGVLLASIVSLDDADGGVSQQRWRSGPRHQRYDFNYRTLESALLRGRFEQLSISVERGRRTGDPRILVATARPAAKRPRPVLSIIVPVYNEKRYIGQTMTELLNKHIQGVDKEIIIVESNSTDGTRDVVRAYEGQPGVRLILEERPQGKGHAVRTALGQATGDVVLIQDADCEYDFDDYEDLLKPLLTYRAAFVLGSRHTGTWKIRNFNDERGLVPLLNFGHSLFVLLLNVLYRQKLKDPFTMYKVFRRDCVHGLKFECDRFDFDFEFVIKMVRKGYTPIEIPVNYRARSWAAGKKVRMFRDPLTWLRALVKYRFAPIG